MGGGAKRQQPRYDLRQEAQVIIGLGRTLERDLQQGDRVRREDRREDGVALDDAGVAVGGLLARRAPVEERNGKPPFGEMQPD